MADTPKDRAARFREVLETRGINPAQWARAANLHRSHLYGLIAKLEAGKDADIEVDTARKLCQAADVSIQWLLTGEGVRDGYSPAGTDDRYPNRQAAAEAARLLRVDPRAIGAVLALDAPEGHDPGTDPDPLWWLRRIELAAQALAVSPTKRERDDG